MVYSTLFLRSSLRLAAILEQFIKNDTGKQNPTKMKSETTMKKNSCSRNVQVIVLSSMSHAQRKVAIIPMIARAASEKTPTLVIFCSVVKFFMTSIFLFDFYLYCWSYLKESGQGPRSCFYKNGRSVIMEAPDRLRRMLYQNAPIVKTL